MFVASLVFAQENVGRMNGRMSGNRKENFENISTELNLTTDQQSKMKSIGEDYKKKMEDLDNQQSLSIKEYNDKKTTLRKEMMSKREAVLTKEQKDKLTSIKSERESRQKENAGKRFEMMKKNLSLTDEQASKISAMQNKMIADVSAIRKDEKLNDQEKKVRINKLREDLKLSTSKILTEEQKTKLNELRKNKSGKR